MIDDEKQMIVDKMFELLRDDFRRKADEEAGVRLSDEEVLEFLNAVLVGRDIWQALKMNLITLQEAASGIGGRFQTWLEHRARTPTNQPARTDWEPFGNRIRIALSHLLER